MFPEVGATELMVIAAVALIVVGPKDLPVLLRKLGQFMARMRGMANEFRASFDEMARQSELDELRREVQALRSGDYLQPLDAAASAHTAPIRETFDEIGQDLTATSGHWETLHPEGAADAPSEPAVAAAKPAAKSRAKAAAKPAASSKVAAKAPAKASVKATAKAPAKAKTPAKPRAKAKPEAAS